MPVSLPRRDGLLGVRVALLEARMGTELAELVRRRGGLVRSAPAVREAPIDCADIVSEFLRRIRPPVRRVHVFLTGAGATALFQEAERQGQLAATIESIKAGIIVCRGPKPAAALKRYGLSPSASAVSPYTSHELLDAMKAIDLAGSHVTLVHYGERSEALSGELRRRGATLDELCLYEWRLPDDVQPLHELARDITACDIDAVIFTSQVQWKHLLQIASGLGLSEALIDALNGSVTVAAVGPICSAALEASGVRPRVVPDNPKMGPLVAALADYFSSATSRPVEAESSAPACGRGPGGLNLRDG